ncbi:Retrovirus-related Pol polyprotein [Labeo rohita]|uniref:Retrovirus-related Pol polyprotein n=1 Tax=Labeo rohita TaxID=84645 RepID=A0ABQ8L1I3_LABRO|nr:Retrovirus-related Pol polyprotein [Labeo rohita]
MEVMKVPIHRIHFQSDLVTDFVEVGVRPVLPVKGVSFILGNDLADGVSGDVAVTKLGDTEAKEVVGSDSLPLTVTREKLVEAQNNDPSLVKCFKLAENAEFDNVSFLVKDGLLMRKWRKSNSTESEWNFVYQVVVPTIFRPQVLSLAHDHTLAGHLGITKTYNRILQHFFWHGLKRDVIRYCKTCHVCQYVGKPNQVIPPAPLIPIPVLSEPFKHVMVDCVGPLPKSKSGNVGEIPSDT